MLGQNTIPAINTTAGYTASSWSCDSGIVPDANGNISLSAGSNVTCTITNTFTGSATLTLVNNVLGGTALPTHWLLSATSFMSGGLSGTSPASAIVSPDIYMLQEDTIPGINTTVGYTASSWSCDSGIVPDAYGQISLSIGSNVTCTITNTYTGSATLTLINNVVGGTALPTDWNVWADSFGQTAIGVSPLTATITPGEMYMLGQNNPAEYVPGAWSCDSGIVPSANNFITLAPGANVTCNITNTFTPVATLTTINVTPVAPSIVAGNTQQMTATTLDQNGAPIAATVGWTSSNLAVGTVDNVTGMFTAVAAGTTTITATSGVVTGTTLVTVTAAGPVCQTTADIDGNGNISNLEILTYVNSWKIGNVSNLQILQGVQFWKAGVGC